LLALAMMLWGAPTAAGVTIGAPQQIGTITNNTLDEISGMVASRTNANTFWVHNDSGDSARFYAMSDQGALLGTHTLSGASAFDWEDIAIGAKPGGGNYLYLGDVGDNLAIRPYVTVYRTDEPQSSAGGAIPTSGRTALNLQFPGGPRDVESMFVDPRSGDLFFITKRTAVPEIYSLSAAAFETPGTVALLTPWGNLGGLPRSPTAADISPDGRFILIRNSESTSGYLYERGLGESVADALHRTGTRFTLGSERQGEAIGWSADGNSFFSTSEFSNLTSAPIHAYQFSAPPELPGDYNNDHVVDAADYAVWRDLLESDVTLPNETVTRGSVTAEDYEVWRDHFGASIGGGSAGASAVPEPGSWLLVSLSAAVMIRVRVRRR
jgi:hypothetical protein